MEKHFTRIVVFVCIFCIIFYTLPNIIEKHRDAQNWDYIYNTDYNIDVLFMGSSLIFTSLNPAIIDPAINYDTFNLGSSSQFIIQTYYNLIEVLKYRKIKLIVLDVQSIVINEVKLGFIYNNLSGMRLSKNKLNSFLNSINNATSGIYDEGSDIIDISKMSYYKQFDYMLSLIVKEKFNWKNNMKSINEIIRGDNTIKSTKGFLERKSTIELNDFNDAKKSKAEDKKISIENLNYLETFIQLCQRNDIDLIFINTPTLIKKESNNIDKQLDYYLKKYDIQYYNFENQYDALNFKREDFSDQIHLSGIGAKKFSLIFSDILSNFLK